MLAQIEVPIIKAYEEWPDQDPDPTPQPIDPGMMEYQYNSVMEVNTSAGYGL